MFFYYESRKNKQKVTGNDNIEIFVNKDGIL